MSRAGFRVLDSDLHVIDVLWDNCARLYNLR